MRVLRDCFHSIRVIIADGGHCGAIINNVKDGFGYLLQVVMRKQSSHKASWPVHKRWVVERTFAWFDNDGRLCCNYEFLMGSCEGVVKLSDIRLLIKDF